MNFLRNIVTLCLLVAMSVVCSVSVAQNLNPSNLSSSPYNRYGYGKLGSMGNSVTRSMGDVGIAVRSNLFTTLANPASLTAIDTLTMIFSVDLDAQNGTMTEGDASSNKWDAGFSGMSFQAPLWRNFAMSLSLSPYSSVGYYYGTTDKTPIQNPTQHHDTLAYASSHVGVGGINNFMFGLGWRPFHTKSQELNLGVNSGWLFGTIQHDTQLSTSSQANSTHISYGATVRGLYLQMGMQYTCRFNATQSVTLGATYSPQLNMHVNTEVMKYSTDTIALTDKFRRGIKQPSRWGVGLSYNIQRKLLVAAEYEMTKWGDIAGLNTELQKQDGIFTDASRVAIGVEYLPKVVTNNFFKACRYRAGFNYKTSYVQVGGSDLSEIGATLGISMPVNKRSAINLGVGYSTLRPSDDQMLKENYLTLNVGLTFNEMMFFRNMLR